jgi:hypothetical protein
MPMSTQFKPLKNCMPDPAGFHCPNRRHALIYRDLERILRDLERRDLSLAVDPERARATIR